MERIGAIPLAEASEHEASIPMLLLIHEDHQEFVGDVNWAVRPEVQQAPVFRYKCKPESLDDGFRFNTQAYSFLSALEDLPIQDKHLSIITTCFGGLVLTKALMLAFTSDATSQANPAVPRHIQALKRVVSVTYVKLADEETSLFHKTMIRQFLGSVFDDGGLDLDISSLRQGVSVDQENDLVQMVLQGIEPRPNKVRVNFFSAQATENGMASGAADVPTSLFQNLPPFDAVTILSFRETSFFAAVGKNTLGEARLIYNAMHAISKADSTSKQSALTPNLAKGAILAAAFIEGSESPNSPRASINSASSESWIWVETPFTSNSLPLETSGLDVQEQVLSDRSCLSRATSRGRRATSSNFNSDRGSFESARTVGHHVTDPAHPTPTNPSRVQPNEVTSYTINNYYGSSQKQTFAAGMAGVAIGACLQSAAASLARVQKQPEMVAPEIPPKGSTPWKREAAHSTLNSSLDGCASAAEADVTETKRLNTIWSKSRIISDVPKGTAEPDGKRNYKEQTFCRTCCEEREPKSRSLIDAFAALGSWSDKSTTSESTTKPHSCTNKRCPKREVIETRDGILEDYINDTDSVQDRLLNPPPYDPIECRKERPGNVLKRPDTNIKNK